MNRVPPRPPAVRGDGSSPVPEHSKNRSRFRHASAWHVR